MMKYSNLPPHEKCDSSESSYPVDDFGLEGADDAAVVEDWMLPVQIFKRCSCLTGEERYCKASSS